MRYFYDLLNVYQRFYSDGSEPGTAFFSISMKQTAILSGIINYSIVSFDLGQEYIWLPAVVPLLFFGFLILNFRWLTVFEKWKKELRRTKNREVKSLNLFLITLIFCIAFAGYSFHLLSNYW